ncbi:MAG: hypothetical protein ACI8ZO_001327 [Flavobacteriales bacterium]|jgi:hypothetical protein
MKRKISLLITLISAAIFTVSCQQEKPKQHPIVGLWKLHIMETRDSINGYWTEWREGMQGYLLYDATENMSLHLTKKGYENFNLEFPNFQDTIPLEALKHLTGSYLYFGKYTIDIAKSQVTHQRISHSNPKEWNATVIRNFTFRNDTLILRPDEEKNAKLRLKWLKN